MKKVAREKKLTSLDVARMAGVSQTTVSFVINGVTTAGISEETRAKVLEVIAQLDYHPNESARSLRNKATHIIGLAVPEAQNEHHQQTATGAEAYARSRGYSVTRLVTNFDANEERICFQLLKQRRFDALIVSLSTGGVLLNEIRDLRKQGYIISGLGYYLQGVEVDNVRVEARSGEEQLLKHLVELGHRRIGYIYGVSSLEIFRERLDTCLEIQQSLGLPVVEPWIRRCGPTLADGYRATQELLAACTGPERPTALVVVNDLLSNAVLAALFAAHIPVPTEMSVASFDNTPLSQYMIPPLTTVDCNAYAMGEHAARLTIERLSQPQRPDESVVMPAQLIVRQSTGPAPSL